jgi:hypothetical protein
MKLHKLDQDARDWLISALDPYHDNQLQLEGLPDMVCAPSVVKMYNQTYTLTAPTSAVANWDAVVAFTGCTSEIDNNPGVVVNPVAGAVAGDDFWATYDHTAYSIQDTFGSFIVKAGEAGAGLGIGAPFIVGDTNLAFGALTLTPNSDRGRIIAVAFEVVNTTAEIYKQGSVTVAMLPGAIGDMGTVTYKDTNGAPYHDSHFQSWYGPKFAATHDALVAVPGSNTWPAKEGCYCIPRMVTHTMPVENPDANKRAAVLQDSRSDTTYFASTPYANITVGGASKAYVHGVSASGFAPIQSYFTGLSHETTLVIKMRTIVEHFPGFGSALLPLCHPSPAFSPKAFELYSAICREAPYAVMAKENSAGEYFRRILAIAAKVGGVLAPLAGPYAPVVTALSGARGALADAFKPKRPAEAARKMVVKQTQAKFPVKRGQAGAGAMATRYK